MAFIATVFTGVVILLPLCLHGARIVIEDPRQDDLVSTGSLSSENKSTVLTFKGSVARPQWDTMEIVRQGITRYRGELKDVKLGVKSFHNELMIRLIDSSRAERPCEQQLFVKPEAWPQLCSTGLFTRQTLTCDPVSNKKIQEHFEHLRPFTPPTDRGFGLEFEFVARDPEPWVDKNFSTSRAMLQDCYEKVVSSDVKMEGYVKCESSNDCAISEYCLDCKKCLSGDSQCGPCSDRMELYNLNICHPRMHCKPANSLEGSCPTAGSLWKWEYDGSVKPLTNGEAEALGADHNETYGLNFEVTSPQPPHVLSGQLGLKSAHEMLTVLKNIGIQAGPSQSMHVHINVLNPEVPGKTLTFRAIANVWAAYAKYQLVINEMLSPSRVRNRYARPLLFGRCEFNYDHNECSTNPCGCIRQIFTNLHDFVGIDVKDDPPTANDFCADVLDTTERPTARAGPCSRKYPNQRYFQLNLLTLHKYGTIEFRAHSATYDAERMARWIQFLIAFVEHFGGSRGHAQMKEFFESNSMDDYKKLRRAQQEATTDELFQDLAGMLDATSKEYFTMRKWEKGDASCSSPPPDAPRVMTPACSNYMTGFTSPEKTLWFSPTQAVLRVVVPTTSKKQHNFSVLLPTGRVWSLKVQRQLQTLRQFGSGEGLVLLPNDRYQPIKRGLVQFVYDHRAEVRRQLTSSFRCCCDDQKCLWFPFSKVLKNGHCPRLIRNEITGSDCSTKRLCFGIFDKKCRQTKHVDSLEMKNYMPRQCELTLDSSAQFRGQLCKDVDQ